MSSKTTTKKKGVQMRYMLTGILFLLPALIGYLLFMGYPMIQTLYVSTMEWGGFGEMTFIGFQNYLDIFKDDTFWFSLQNTLYFAIFSAIFSVLIGAVVAWLILFLNKGESRIHRTLMFSPAMISPTITGLLFLFIFTEDIGLLNNILISIGLENFVTAWLVDLATVKPVVVIATVWRQFGLTMVLCFAGLQGVSNELLESARLDGANNFKIFSRILMPLIKPQIEIATMFTMVGGLRIYDSIVSLTKGGPARQTVVLPMWIIENAFTYSNFGYASAMCIIFILIVFLFIAVLKFAFRGESNEY